MTREGQNIFGNEFWTGPSPRQLKLQQQQQGGLLPPDEEGELRGLFAYPNDPEAQSLVKLEYLASKGLAEMLADQKERLRVIRAEAWKTRPQIERNHATTETNEGLAGRVELDMIHTQAKIAFLSGKFEGEPKNTLDRLLAETPDDITVYTKDTIGSMPKDEPSDFELFFLSRISKLPEFLDAKRQDGSLTVMESIRCLRDRIRTKKFLAGVAEAIQSLGENLDEIHVCDAGCGAIPVQAIYAALSSPKVRCTCIELNPNSAEMAKRIVAAFELQDRIKIVQTDATKFQADSEIDLLISETMHSGLTAEPLVQIMSNLAPQVKPEGIKLPNKVIVKAGLIKVKDYVSPKGYVRIYRNLHPYVEPAWQTVVEYKPGDKLEEIKFDLPTEGLEPGIYFVMLTSEVDIGSQHLSPYQALITIPQVLREQNMDPKFFEVKTGIQKIHAEYKPGTNLKDITSTTE
jgi:predicted RNA methylase